MTQDLLRDASRGGQQRLPWNAALNAAGSLSYYVAVVFLTPVAIRALGDRGWGIWQLVGAATSYALLLNLGLASAVAHQVSAGVAVRDLDRVASSVNNTRLYYVAVAVAILVGFAAGGRALVTSLLEGPEAQLAWAALAVSVGVTAFTLPVRVHQSVISGLQRYDLLAGFRLASGVLLLGGVIGGFAAGMGLVGFAFVMTSAPVLPALLSWLFARRILPRGCLRWRRANPAHLRSMMLYSTSTVLYTTGAVVLYQTMKFVASWRCGGTVAAGHMGLVVSLVQTLSVLFIPLAAVLQPRVSELWARGRGDQLPDLLRRSVASMGLVAVPILAFLLLETHSIFAAWVGDTLPADAVSRISRTARYMLIGQGLYVVFLPFFYGLLGVGEHRTFGLGMLAAGGVNAALGWAATQAKPTIEALGLAFGLTLTGLVLFVTLPVALRRFSLSVRDVTLQPIAIPLLVVAPAIVVAALRPRLGEPRLDLALAAVLFGASALPGWLLARKRL